MKHANLARITILVAMTTTLMTSAQAQTFRYDSGITGNHVLNIAPNKFGELIDEATGGEMSLQNFTGSLQTITEAPFGLRDGILDFAINVPHYAPGEFPVNSFIAQLPAYSTSSVATTAADTEFVMVHCQECREEYASQNQVPLVMASHPVYHPILSSRDVVTPEDIAGLRLRSGGDYYRDWIEHFGGVAVSMPGTELFDAMNSGILDGSVASLLDVPAYQLNELLRSISLVEVAPFHTFTVLAARQDLWQGLPEETRTLFLEKALEAQVEQAIATDTTYREVVESFVARDAAIEPSQALIDANREFAEGQLERVVEIALQDRGIENAEELARTYVELTTEWEERLEGVDIADPEVVLGLYRDEILSQIDSATYGM